LAVCSLIGPLGVLTLLAQGGAAPDSASAESLAFRATVFAGAAFVPAPVAFSVDDRGVV
jgi:hypothetical protein